MILSTWASESIEATGTPARGIPYSIHVRGGDGGVDSNRSDLVVAESGEEVQRHRPTLTFGLVSPVLEVSPTRIIVEKGSHPARVLDADNKHANKTSSSGSAASVLA